MQKAGLREVILAVVRRLFFPDFSSGPKGQPHVLVAN